MNGCSSVALARRPSPQQPEAVEPSQEDRKPLATSEEQVQPMETAVQIAIRSLVGPARTHCLQVSQEIRQNRRSYDKCTGTQAWMSEVDADVPTSISL